MISSIPVKQFLNGSVSPIDGTQTGANTSGQIGCESGPGSNGNEKVLCTSPELEP